jgi:hypothetical protein
MKRHIEKLSEADVLGQYPIFAPAQPDNPAASLKDYCSGAYKVD